MTVETVHADIKLGAFKPFDFTFHEIPRGDCVPLSIPLELLCNLSPKAVGVFDAPFPHRLILLKIGDVGLAGDWLRWWKSSLFIQQILYAFAFSHRSMRRCVIYQIHYSRHYLHLESREHRSHR